MTDLILADTKNKEILAQLAKLGYKSAVKVMIFKPDSYLDFKKLKKIPTDDTLVLGSSQDEKIIRQMLEDKQIDGIINVESSTGREHTHYRRGNINQVIAKIAKDKGKYYFVDFSRILKTPENRRYILLGRIMQNIKILQKYEVPISIASFARDVYGLRNRTMLTAFARVLKAKKVTQIEKILQEKQDKLTGRIVRKGVKVLD